MPMRKDGNSFFLPSNEAYFVAWLIFLKKKGCKRENAVYSNFF